MLTMLPITFKQANEFVALHHRHHKPVVGCKFVVGLTDNGASLVGVAIASRPTARMSDDGFTLEVTRLCTDGTRNACSKLYNAVARIARELGYRRLITYTLPEEGGASLRAADWVCHGEAGGGSWNCESRPREDKHPLTVKHKWSRPL